MEINILCVDDDPNILEAYRRAFGRRYNVYLAQGPLQGVDKLQLGPFYSAIISDKKMPLMDGINFLELAQHMFPGSYRVMLTGAPDDPAALQALHAGTVQRLLAKPCPVQDMEKALQEGIAQAWQRMEAHAA